MAYRNRGDIDYHAVRKSIELLSNVQLHLSEMFCNFCQWMSWKSQ